MAGGCVMKVLNYFCCVLLGAGLAACAAPVQTVHKDWIAHDGSRADGTVTLVLTWDPATEDPRGSKKQARAAAADKCRAWGYADAEAFGSISARCIRSHFTELGAICLEMRAEMNFQCIGQRPGH